MCGVEAGGGGEGKKGGVGGGAKGGWQGVKSGSKLVEG